MAPAFWRPLVLASIPLSLDDTNYDDDEIEDIEDELYGLALGYEGAVGILF